MKQVLFVIAMLAFCAVLVLGLLAGIGTFGVHKPAACPNDCACPCKCPDCTCDGTCSVKGHCPCCCRLCPNQIDPVQNPDFQLDTETGVLRKADR